ncbi:pleiotropic regulatory protein RsmS [Pseudoalteromonas luteoviolacea]|uniref:Primosomal protein n=1 Tax=Pseudoalteromonas luteoviolacea DSM 6061 TaxID=1365250 RepID=A0A166WMT4_9GAMM|nr:pleiotropic regulatory protein RsmS [Pseudoalteromonas luteoviolacea]KZN37668.1 hypothetical protein N475_02330 [Pseudoalteromonas luteoviolacea DSM 6061]KZN49694.1 hypothetical protein N474_05420 [Pseudoalteromonas luteoviolacea CPMOR-2]MBE0386906.1 hypothetical protein [Pseudoalteromonas luteoviolacea DSM 6061]TQF71721.1 DUF2496 domain-containing protein [Pseudoalteromonas luteoviolacea]
MNDHTSPLDNAPQHVKLAVDLIMLLEQNDVPPEEVLQALEIVKQDFLHKVQSNLEQKT